MEIKFLKKTDSEVEFTIVGEETLLNPLKAKIAENPNISFVGYKKEHPLRETITFVIKGKKPYQALKKGLSELNKIYKDILAQFK